jgi:DNA polymerase III subunit epsilon
MGIPGQMRQDGGGYPARRLARPWSQAWSRAGRMPWRAGRYCALDLETTGLDLRRDAIVSVGAVLIEGGRVIAGSALYRLVASPLGSSPAAIAVHALRPADLAGAPPWEETAAEVLSMLDGRILVAHAAWIERAFLRRAFAGRGGPAAVIDTAALARAAGLAPAPRPGRRVRAEPGLEGLAADLGLPGHEPHHALGDALTTAEVFLALAARLDGGGPPATVGSLISLSRRFSGSG